MPGRIRKVERERGGGGLTGVRKRARKGPRWVLADASGGIGGRRWGIAREEGHGKSRISRSGVSSGAGVRSYIQYKEGQERAVERAQEVWGDLPLTRKLTLVVVVVAVVVVVVVEVVSGGDIIGGARNWRVDQHIVQG